MIHANKESKRNQRDANDFVVNLISSRWRRNPITFIPSSIIGMLMLIIVSQFKYCSSTTDNKYEVANYQNCSLSPVFSRIQLPVEESVETNNIQLNPSFFPSFGIPKDGCTNYSLEEHNDLSVASKVTVPTFSFFVMGDTPYSEREEILLSKQILGLENDINESDGNSLFLVHVGDLMRSISCGKWRYQLASNILNKSSLPLLVIPGDNDWIDCPNPKIAMRRFRKFFIRRYKRRQTSFKLMRQDGRKENFSFWHNDILFFGLNVRVIFIAYIIFECEVIPYSFFSFSQLN